DAGRKSASLRVYLRTWNYLDHLLRPFPLMLLLVTFAPIVAAVLIMLGLPARTTALAASVLTLVTSVLLFLSFDSIARGFQFVFTIPISTELRLNFALGVDGLSLLMILLGAIVLLAAVWFTGEFERHDI